MSSSIDSPQIILWMIGICIAFMVIMLFIRPIKTVGKICMQGAVGMVVAYVINFFGAAAGFSIGLNIVNAVVIGVLGVPGFISLYVAQLFL